MPGTYIVRDRDGVYHVAIAVVSYNPNREGLSKDQEEGVSMVKKLFEAGTRGDFEVRACEIQDATALGVITEGPGVITLMSKKPPTAE